MKKTTCRLWWLALVFVGGVAHAVYPGKEILREIPLSTPAKIGELVEYETTDFRHAVILRRGTVYALAGQRVRPTRDKLWVDGETLFTWSRPELPRTAKDIRIPPNHVFVINRQHLGEGDSLALGPLPVSTIKKRFLVLVLP